MNHKETIDKTLSVVNRDYDLFVRGQSEGSLRIVNVTIEKAKAEMLATIADLLIEIRDRLGDEGPVAKKKK